MCKENRRQRSPVASFKLFSFDEKWAETPDGMSDAFRSLHNFARISYFNIDQINIFLSTFGHVANYRFVMAF